MTKALGGEASWDFKQVALDAFGSALGNSIVKEMTALDRAIDDVDREMNRMFANVDEKDLYESVSNNPEIPESAFIAYQKAQSEGAVPPAKIKTEKGMGFHVAKYDNENQEIILNHELVEQAKTDPLVAAMVMSGVVHEQGHHVDYLLRNVYSDVGGDTYGDEGAAYAYQHIAALMGDSAYDVSMTIGLADNSSITLNTNKLFLGAMQLQTMATINSGLDMRDGRYEYYSEAGHYYTAHTLARELGVEQSEALVVAAWSQMGDMIDSMDAVNNAIEIGIFDGMSESDMAQLKRTQFELHALFEKPKLSAEFESLLVSRSLELSARNGGSSQLANALLDKYNKELYTVWQGKLMDERQLTRGVIVGALKNNELAVAGLGVHRLGDLYAHTRNVTAGGESFIVPYEIHIGHGLDGHTPDQISRRLGNYVNYVNDLANVFNEGFGLGLSQNALKQRVGKVTDILANTYINEIGKGRGLNHSQFENSLRSNFRKRFAGTKEVVLNPTEAYVFRTRSNKQAIRDVFAANRHETTATYKIFGGPNAKNYNYSGYLVDQTNRFVDLLRAGRK